MARAALYFGLTPSIFSCIPVGLTKHVHEYRIGSRSYWEPFGCSAVLLRSSNILATRRPRNPTHGNGNVWMTMNSIFWLDVSKKYLKWMWVC